MQAREPVPGNNGTRAVSGRCSAGRQGERHNPWLCRVRYASGREVDYQVVIDARGAFRGVNSTGERLVRGCCIAVPTAAGYPLLEREASAPEQVSARLRRCPLPLSRRGAAETRCDVLEERFTRVHPHRGGELSPRVASGLALRDREPIVELPTRRLRLDRLRHRGHALREPALIDVAVSQDLVRL